MIDHLLNKMSSRFDSQQQAALLGFNILPSVAVTLTIENCINKANALAEVYIADLPSLNLLNSEIECWHLKWMNHLKEHGPSSLPTNPLSALRHATSMYPNIRVLLRVLCTIPVTSCTAERSFSGLKRTKTLTRSSMMTQRLSGLSLLTIHHDIPVDISMAIDEFSRCHPRRIELHDILKD